MFSLNDQLLERFWNKVEVQPSGCWEWMAYKWPDGYGCFYFDGKLVRAHRFSYELNKGKIPVGLQLDHLCRNRRCVNPTHLQPVTCKENLHRSPIVITTICSNKTHCPRGHELIGSNLDKWQLAHGNRICRKCKNENMKTYKQKEQEIEEVGN